MLDVVVELEDDPVERPPRRSNDVGFEAMLVLVVELFEKGFPRPGIDIEKVCPSFRL